MSMHFDIPYGGHVYIGAYFCGSQHGRTFSSLLLAYKVILTVIGGGLAFKVRSLGAFFLLLLTIR